MTSQNNERVLSFILNTTDTPRVAITYVSQDLESLQGWVDGYITEYSLPDGHVMILNDDFEGLKRNFIAEELVKCYRGEAPWGGLYGTVLVFHVTEEGDLEAPTQEATKYLMEALESMGIG